MTGEQVCSMLLMLIAAHALCDFPLQGDFLAKAKNHKRPLDGVEPTMAMALHGAIHAGAVLLITHSYCWACVEWIAHTVIDRCKCEDILTFNQDQILHLACKVGYVAGLMAMGVP